MITTGDKEYYKGIGESNTKVKILINPLLINITTQTK